MLKLISEDETYEKVWKLDDEPEDKWPAFILRKLTSAKVNSIDDQITKTAKGATIVYLGGTQRRLRIDAALVDWRNVFGSDSNPVPCNSTNKEKLPAEIQGWLEEDIEEVNRLRGLTAEERKNS